MLLECIVFSYANFNLLFLVLRNEQLWALNAIPLRLRK